MYHLEGTRHKFQYGGKNKYNVEAKINVIWRQIKKLIKIAEQLLSDYKSLNKIASRKFGRKTKEYRYSTILILYRYSTTLLRYCTFKHVRYHVAVPALTDCTVQVHY